MKGDTFEYAIKKDIRNNPIVREVDRERHHEMWRSALIGVFLVMVLLFSAWQHFEQLRHGYQLEEMQAELNKEEAANRFLRLEVETLKAPARIEDYATDHLRMVAPTDEDAVVIERVIPPPPPPSSVVAQQQVENGVSGARQERQ
jgi:cell division protein FtsL